MALPLELDGVAAGPARAAGLEARRTLGLADRATARSADNDGRPVDEANRSAMNESGNSSPRCSAKNANTLPGGTLPHHGLRVQKLPLQACPALHSKIIPDRPATSSQTRRPKRELFSSLLGTEQLVSPRTSSMRSAGC